MIQVIYRIKALNFESRDIKNSVEKTIFLLWFFCLSSACKTIEQDFLEEWLRNTLNKCFTSVKFSSEVFSAILKQKNFE